MALWNTSDPRLTPRSRPGHPSRRRRPTRRVLHLEILEDRQLLSIVDWVGAADGGDGGVGHAKPKNPLSESLRRDLLLFCGSESALCTE